MTDPISNDLARFMADEIGHGMSEKVQRFADLAVQFYSRRQSPAGVEPVGEAVAMPGSNGGFTMAAFEASKVPVGTKLYASPTKAVTITDEVLDPLEIEKLNRRWHGEDHRTVSVRWEPYKKDGRRQMGVPGRWQEQIGNGDYWRWQNCERPENLTNTAALSSEPHNGREGE